MKNILHADSNRFFQFWTRQNVKSLVTDRLEDNVGYLVRRHLGLYSLTHKLHQCLAFGTQLLFSQIILESGRTIAN